jgi:ribonuclease HI
MEYRDERDLHIYTDGSSYSGPRRGGVGILFVSVDDAGEERVDAYPESGYLGATNQQMELRAAIDALAALVRGSAPVSASPFRQIVIWTDSMYLVDGYNSARFSWLQTGWTNRDGNPVANAPMWKELLKIAGRTGKRVEIKWVKGHKKSAHNKAADKLAKESAKTQLGRRASIVKVRRKQTSKSVQVGSVRMRGQRVTIRIITDEYLPVQRLNKYKYEVVSKASEFHGNVDLIYSSAAIHLSAGHTYYVRFNDDSDAPRVVKTFREVPTG